MTFAWLLMTALLLPARSGEGRDQGIAFAVAAEVERVPAGSLWPGFDPRSTPLAIFDGERTYLFRHPDPPSEFQPIAGQRSVSVFAGQHALMRANTSIALGGVATATLLLDAGEKRSTRELASIAAHEMFHVFQADRHPKWGGNEVDLFTYPIDDPGLLDLARLEVEALRRALGAKRNETAACWTAAALDVRRRRFGLLGETGASYERGTEMKEGLATLVERRVFAGARPASILPAQEFAAGEVRSRSYAVGHALGALLDRFSSGWETRLENGPERPLDALLADALAPRSPRGCRFSRAELAESLDRSRKSIELARLTRDAVREDFFKRKGWKVVFAAEGEPFSVERFDPLNVERLRPGEILHTRWIRLGGERGSIEVMDRRSLTESAGTSHPLFAGVRRLTMTGLSEEPRVSESPDGVSVRAPGLTADLRRARLVREGETLTVTLSR